MTPAYQQVTVQIGGNSVMIWIMDFWCGQGPLVKLEPVLTGVIHTDLVAENLHHFMFSVMLFCFFLKYNAIPIMRE